MNIKEIIKEAKRFKRKTGGTPTFERSRDFIKTKGYTVLLFDEDTEEVYTYGLNEILADKEAYTYLQNVKLIFIRKSLDAETKHKRLLHEIGHIVLEHLYNDILTVSDKEQEAETFVYYVLQSLPKTDVKAKIAIVALSVCLAASSSANIYQYAHVIKSKITPQTEALEQSDTNYYVTKSGGKYHRKTCRYATGGEAVTEEYAKASYEPCKICNP